VAALAREQAALHALQAEVATMLPQVQQLRTLRRAALPLLSLLMAGAPGLGFGVRTAYVAYAAGAWVYGGEALGASCLCLCLCVS
jgi:hypothetical protein